MSVASVGTFFANEVSAQDGIPSHYAIENARLVRLTGPTIENGTIVVRNGIITAIGDDVKTPPGAWVIDGAGLTVYPGLIDGLSTLGMSNEDAPPARQGGPRPGGGPPGGRGGGPDAAPRSEGPEDRPATFAWINAADRLELDDDEFGRWRAAGFTSALTAPSNGFFSGNAAIINLAGERPRDLVVTTSAAQRLNLNGGPGHRGFPSSQPGVFAYIKQFFGDAEHYRDVTRLYNEDPSGRERPTYDRALEGIMPVLGGPVPLLFPASTTTEIRRAMRISAQIGANPIIYGAQSAHRMVDELSSSRLLVSLDWPEAPEDGDPEADTSLDVLRHRLLAPTAPARLHESGVPFAFYSDGLGPKEVISAARKAVEAGLPHDDAVEALSLGVARIFGVDDRLGALQEGFIANLVVTDGDLLA
ncbi:MAG: amidohydrolase family protein, partial [Longimicrobiales bacterium]